jgi:hypothetical protein
VQAAPPAQAPPVAAPTQGQQPGRPFSPVPSPIPDAPTAPPAQPE